MYSHKSSFLEYSYLYYELIAKFYSNVTKIQSLQSQKSVLWLYFLVGKLCVDNFILLLFTHSSPDSENIPGQLSM